MTAPKICEYCGACLDAGEKCDCLFERAQFVNGDSQLYKQAGNSVTVPVVKAIGEKIK